MDTRVAIEDRTPPADHDAERWVIGSILLSPSQCDEVAFLTADEFHNETHKAIASAIFSMHHRGEPIDAALVARSLGGGDWRGIVVELASSVPVAKHCKHYAEIVATTAKLRRLRQIGLTIAEDSHRKDANPDDILEAGEAALSAIRMGKASVVDPKPIGVAALDAISRIDAMQRRGESFGLATGLEEFDAQNGGLSPGELIILAARPGNGKTSLAMQIAAHNASRNRLCYFASLEMSCVELSTRQACGDSGVSSMAVRSARLTQQDTSRLSDAFALQNDMALDIHDRSAISVSAVRREVRKRMKRGLRLAVVDYLQLIRPDDKKLPREQQVAGIVRGLKEIAREYNIPVLCLSQLNRVSANDDIPELSHLRESGSIEQDADVVLFLSRHTPNKKPDGSIEFGDDYNALLTVAKNRNGSIGQVKLQWDGPRTRFSCYKPMADSHSEFDQFGGNGGEEWF